MEGRLPPHSDDAERSVLGAALQSKNALYDVMETLSADDFYHRETHGEIFLAMQELYREGAPVDLVTCAEVLKKRKTLGQVGDSGYLGQLVSMVPSPSSASQYAKIISEKSILRKLIDESSGIIEKSFQDKGDALEVLDEAERKILDIGQSRHGKDFVSISDALEKTIEHIEKMKDVAGGITGLETGFVDLDKLTSGLQPSDLVILAARPGKGKTSLALNIALNAAIKNKDANVIIFSLEMPQIQLTQRLLSAESNVNLSRIRDGKAFTDKAERERVIEASEDLSKLKIHIVDAVSGITINEIKNKCRRLKAKDGLDLIVIDYLQLMHLSGASVADLRPDSRAQEIAILTRMMKQLAGEMNCPLLLLSQLSRGVESRKEPRPILSDLRESGAIEQDADIVMFIYSESKEDEDDNLRKLLIEKHRNGETGEITLTWLGAYTKFANSFFKKDEELPF
jgi:replicative DNA helicase